MTTIPRKPEDRCPAIHPSEFLREDFMKPLQLTASGLARALKVPAPRVSQIVNERRGLDAELVRRLTRYFGMAPGFWMRMQTRYDLDVAEDALAARIRREVRPAPHDPVTGELIPAKSENAGPSTRRAKNIARTRSG